MTAPLIPGKRYLIKNIVVDEPQPSTKQFKLTIEAVFIKYYAPTGAADYKDILPGTNPYEYTPLKFKFNSSIGIFRVIRIISADAVSHYDRKDAPYVFSNASVNLSRITTKNAYIWINMHDSKLRIRPKLDTESMLHKKAADTYTRRATNRTKVLPHDVVEYGIKPFLGGRRRGHRRKSRRSSFPHIA